MKKIIKGLLVLGLCLSFSGCSNSTESGESKQEETTKFYEYDDQEVFDYLEKKDYLIDTSEDENGRFVYIHNDEEIWIQKIITEYIPEPMYTFHNGKINDQHAEIKNTADNDTDELKKQYAAYSKWLKKMGLKHEQIISLLDYCDDSNN